MLHSMLEQVDAEAAHAQCDNLLTSAVCQGSTTISTAHAMRSRPSPRSLRRSAARSGRAERRMDRRPPLPRARGPREGPIRLGITTETPRRHPSPSARSAP